MRHDDERPRPRPQHRFQRLDAAQVEVIGRLVDMFAIDKGSRKILDRFL